MATPQDFAKRRGTRNPAVSSIRANAARAAAARTTDIEAQKAQPSEATPLVAKHVEKSDGSAIFFSKLFLRDRNELFAGDVEIALRVACVTLGLSMPMMFPRGFIPFGSWFVDHFLITPTTLQYVFFTISGTAGRTIRQGVNSLVGVIFAIFCIWTLTLVYPGGVQRSEHSAAAWSGLILGIFFTIGVPFLNLPMTTTIFACSRFVCWWMEYMNPDRATIDMEKEARNELAAAIAGSLASIAATLLPRPLLATRKSEERADRLAKAVGKGWSDFIAYFCAEEKNQMQVSRLDSDLRTIFDEAKELETYIADSWWECIFDPAKQSARSMLSRQHAFVIAAYGRLLDVQYLCIREDFDDIHDDLAEAVKPLIVSATTASCGLLHLCAQVSCDGQITDEEARAMKYRMEETETAVSTLSSGYKAAKEDVIKKHFGDGAEKKELICRPLMDEDAFCFEVCSFCGLVLIDASDLLAQRAGTKRLPEPEGPKDGSLDRMFDPDVVFSNGQAVFALKAAMAILLGFCVGYVSEGTLLRQYDASVAFLVALLTKKGGGSALSRSMARLLGMVIGFVIGTMSHTLIFDVLRLCGVEGQAIMSCIIFVWVAVAMFVYFNSETENNRYMGQLLAIVGTPAMVARCHVGQRYDYRGNQFQTNSIVVVLLIMATVNNLFSSRVSLQAHEVLREVWRELGESLEELFDHTAEVSHHRQHAIRAKIQRAQYLGSEAMDEPRFWRTPWRADLFATACQKAERIRLAIRSIQRVGTEGGERSEEMSAARNATFANLLQIGNFRTLTDTILLKHELIERLLDIFVHEDTTPMPELSHEGNMEDHHLQWSAALDGYDSSFKYSWGEQEKKSIELELEEQRIHAGGCEQGRWWEAVQVWDKYNARLTSLTTIGKDRFPLSVKIKLVGFIAEINDGCGSSPSPRRSMQLLKGALVRKAELGDTLESDGACQINRITLNLGALMYEMSSLQSEILTSS